MTRQYINDSSSFSLDAVLRKNSQIVIFSRCHRIGQTRDVHIYRMVSERTVEENILKKANQKRMLGDLAIEGGNFTTAFFKKQTISDLFEVDENTLQVILDLLRV